MSDHPERAGDRVTAVVADAAEEALPPAAAEVIAEELELLEGVQRTVARAASALHREPEDLDAQLIELRDMAAEAKEEDVASLIEQMHQVAALSARRGKGKDLPVDPNSPYFGHLRLRETRTARTRDVLIGKRTLLAPDGGASIVDWRNAPVSRLYYRYEEGDDYDEEFDDRSLEGSVLVRRSVAIVGGRLRRVHGSAGTFVSSESGQWRAATVGARPVLEGGVGTALRAARGELGVRQLDTGIVDKHLQEITALIDRDQFAMITQPEAGIVLIQGGAGSGKTTVALHRVAYLAFRDPARFSARDMVIVVFNEALVEYVRLVLPSLGVGGVPVTTYRRWSAGVLRRVGLALPDARNESTPEVVSRFKKHPAMLTLVDERVGRAQREAEQALAERLEGRERSAEVLRKWRELAALAPVVRSERMLAWVRAAGGTIPARTLTAAETALVAIDAQLRDVVEDWMELLGEGPALREAIARLAPGDFGDRQVDAIVEWCARQVASMVSMMDPDEDPDGGDLDEGEGASERDEEESCAPALDGEDDAILLRLLQCKFGGLFVAGRRLQYEHIVIDEAQDLCPLEVRVLLECASAGRSVTIAGDKAQKMIFDNSFHDWPRMLADAGLPHVAVQPLRITYRSTRQVMQLARHVLGPLHDPADDLIARDGAPVSYYGFSDMGESVAFLADALRSLILREPSASVAVITRHPEQARVYYEALRRAEVARLRLVAEQDFSFTAGIDVTDVRQVKGLEFDYVVLVDPTRQNYPEETESRHLLHIAATRCAYQLWLVGAGAASPLLPSDLVAAGELAP